MSGGKKMVDFIEELWDEVTDFFEDFFELLTERSTKEPTRKRTVVINGTEKIVRPAYIFAERVDNSLRIVFGGSILVSAISATFLGFSSLSELVEALLFSILGRVVLSIIGFSYLIIALWRLMHVRKN
jgi:hypothetical protein